ncbi:serine/threonine protein kinase [Bradyrhizobium sp. B025]|uniref:serine/threonine protein kinase n=1 Tax=Bradyrhizobium sp. B025 TaxID=3344829 RepID=UPI0035D473E7
MSYPQIVDYNDAVQDPRTFSDPELKAGQVATTPLGLPLALSGGFALTYTVQSGQKKLAVRCFHREVPDAQNRYARVSSKLRSLGSNYFVNFDFQPQGIRIRGRSYPIVKMDWAEGKTLSAYLDQTVSNGTAVANLRSRFASLAEYLELSQIAHGDIQNENVIVHNGALRLIDYDGMYVAGLPEGRGTEVGHKHFQHPGRTIRLFGPKMDRFSFIVVDLSLEALQADPALHKRFREGGNAIIFNANDFADPSSSEIFRILNGMPAVRESAMRLAAICISPISDVPMLSDFRAGRNVPTPTVRPVAVSTKPTQPKAYIGAFPVLDGRDFQAVMRRVGDKVELIGQIVSVKEGLGRRGRGRGLPYVFINFGPWNQESVKITIWSEGLGNISTRPSASWAGKWISVTGLIDPPYEGKHYGRPYKNVGIAVVADNQIVSITEQEAKFRLGRGAPARSPSEPRSYQGSNADILRGIRSGSTDVPKEVPRPPRSPPTSPSQPIVRTRNEQILRDLQPASATPSPRTPPAYQAPPPAPSENGWLSKIGIGILIFLVIGLLKALATHH